MRRRTTDQPPEPTSYRTLRERPLRSLRYPLHLRLADWSAGRRDGRIDLTGTGAAGGAAAQELLTEDTTVWLRHNQHRRDERHEHEQLAHQARTVRLAIRRQALEEEIEAAGHERDAARATLDAIATPGEAELTQRGAAEGRTPEQVVRARRTREHARTTLDPARRRVQTAEDRLRSLTSELHDVAARLDVLERVTATRRQRITEFHQRRGAVYRRAYLRAARRTRQGVDGRAATPASVTRLPGG